MLDAALFDLDGLLVDSEPVWRRAELAVLVDGLGLPLTEPDTHRTTGLRVDEVVAYWRARFPFKTPSDDVVAAQIADRVVREMRERGQPQPGAFQAIRCAREAGLKVAVATSSPRALAEAVLEALGLRPLFQAVAAGDEHLLGKPHPAVYLDAAARVGADPRRCLALEDSLPGLIAAKAARMRCVVVPSEARLTDPRWSLADRVLPTLEAVTPALLVALAQDEPLSSVEAVGMSAALSPV